MYEALHQVKLFEGLRTGAMERLSRIGRRRALHAGEHLFLLGDSAQYLSVVLQGRVALCFPISAGGVVKDITVESVGPGKVVGWSALVKPFRFTLTARALEQAEVMAFGRHELLELFDSDPEIGRVVLGGISEIVATRLSMFQALWARELQRTLEAGRTATAI